MLARLPRVTDENVLVGFDTADDAGVYRLTPECALVQTVDFFTPIVDDPYTYGAVAAANALSDVYAMGGRPLSALSIVCYPAKGEIEDLARILEGGAAKIREAGCALVGGHSVADEEIKFGYAVTGVVHPERVLVNAGARPGDVLILTKPLGTGVISTALKKGLARQEHVDASVAGMLELNQRACEAMEGLQVHGCTDVTGFGLLGHAREVALASGVTLVIEAARVPLLAGALEYARLGAVPGGLKNNREFVGGCVEVRSAVAAELESLLYDPQTSGGLLISVAAGDAGALAGRLEKAAVIGRVLARQGAPIHIV